MTNIIERENIVTCTWLEMKENEAHHNHTIIIDDDRLYWGKTMEKDDLNKKWEEWTKKGLTKNSEVVRKYYRDIGYSLYGYWEIFYWDVNNPIASEYKPPLNKLVSEN
jgi:hypothetical protein